MAPGGERVYAAGGASLPSGEAATFALDASTGQALWKHAVTPPLGVAVALDVAAAEDGLRVFVTHAVTKDAQNQRLVRTDALHGPGGALLWQRELDAGAAFSQEPRALRESADGARLYVAGFESTAGTFRYLALAYDVVTGAELWAVRPEAGDVDRTGGGGRGAPRRRAGSPDGCAPGERAGRFGRRG